MSTSKIRISGSTIGISRFALVSDNDVDESIRKYPISAIPKMHPSSSGKDLIVLRRLPRFRLRDSRTCVREGITDKSREGFRAIPNPRFSSVSRSPLVSRELRLETQSVECVSIRATIGW